MTGHSPPGIFPPGLLEENDDSNKVSRSNNESASDAESTNKDVTIGIKKN